MDHNAPARLALFDLDLTLIPFDSGMAWTQFLIRGGILPPESEAQYLAFAHHYIAGTLDIHAMHRHHMQPLLRHERAKLAQWQREFAQEMAPRLPPASLALVRRHQAQGDLCAIVTATNDLIAGPIAQLFGVDELLSTRAATSDGLAHGAYTGEIEGDPCYREHKLARVNAWLAARPPGAPRRLGDFEQSWFYSDSFGDLPLLSAVSHPVAVAPDERLRAHALQAGWPVMELPA